MHRQLASLIFFIALLTPSFANTATSDTLFSILSIGGTQAEYGPGTTFSAEVTTLVTAQGRAQHPAGPEDGWIVHSTLVRTGPSTAVVGAADREATYEAGSWLIKFTLPQQTGNYSLVISLTCGSPSAACWTVTGYYDGGSGQQYSNSAESFVPLRIRPIAAPATSPCTDTDGGANYSVRGTVTGLSDASTTQTKTDECGTGSIERGKLVEYVCMPNGYIQKTYYICPLGCNQGACTATGGGLHLIRTQDTSGTLRTQTGNGSQDFRSRRFWRRNAGEN